MGVVPCGKLADVDEIVRQVCLGEDDDVALDGL